MNAEGSILSSIGKELKKSKDGWTIEGILEENKLCSSTLGITDEKAFGSLLGKEFGREE